MKDKIMMLVIGFLLGSVITTGVCYLYIKSNYSNQSVQMNGGQPPQMPSGQNGQPPEKPSNDSEPPEIQNNSNQESN